MKEDVSSTIWFQLSFVFVHKLHQFEWKDSKQRVHTKSSTFLGQCYSSLLQEWVLYEEENNLQSGFGTKSPTRSYLKSKCSIFFYRHPVETSKFSILLTNFLLLLTTWIICIIRKFRLWVAPILPKHQPKRRSSTILDLNEGKPSQVTT